MTIIFASLTFSGLQAVPEGNFFCSICSDTTQPSHVKSQWFTLNHVKFQEIVDTTYTSDEEDNDYQSSESGEIDIDEPGMFSTILLYCYH